MRRYKRDNSYKIEKVTWGPTVALCHYPNDVVLMLTRREEDATSVFHHHYAESFEDGGLFMKGQHLLREFLLLLMLVRKLSKDNSISFFNHHFLSSEGTRNLKL